MIVTRALLLCLNRQLFTLTSWFLCQYSTHYTNLGMFHFTYCIVLVQIHATATCSTLSLGKIVLLQILWLMHQLKQDFSVILLNKQVSTEKCRVWRIQQWERVLVSILLIVSKPSWISRKKRKISYKENAYGSRLLCQPVYMHCSVFTWLSHCTLMAKKKGSLKSID